MTFDSLILSGFSGVGKDTLYEMLAADYPNTINVKFSSLTKDILANAFRVPRHWLDGQDNEPKWREQPLYAGGKYTEVTPLMLLQALFYGAPHTQLHELNIQYALNNIPADSFPVFTDIRRQQELDVVKAAGYNPLYVYLRRPDVISGEADVEVIKLKNLFAHNTIFSQPGCSDTAYESLKSLLERTTLNLQKPTLRLYVGCSPSFVISHEFPNYEPMRALLDNCRQSLTGVFKLPAGVVYKRTVEVFQALISEADLSTVELAPLIKDSWMSYNDSYEPLLPRLREMANLKLYFSIEGNELGNADTRWTMEEKKNATLV